MDGRLPFLLELGLPQPSFSSAPGELASGKVERESKTCWVKRLVRGHTVGPALRPMPLLSAGASLLANRPFLGAVSEGVIVLGQVWPFPLGCLNLSGALSSLL